MLKSASQFRNPHLLSQVIFLTFHSRTCRANLPHYILNGPYIQCYVGLYSEKPGPHKPGNEKKERTLLIHDRYPSTERKSFSNLENRKPDLGGSGLSAVNGDVVPPIIAYPAKKASSFLLCTETFMSERFLKCIDGPLTDYLLQTNHHAWALIWIIAKRARQVPGLPDGLKVGEALIGDWAKYGFTRQNYRTALKFLCKQKIVKIVETNRNCKKSTIDLTTGVTTGVTINGTKVKLLDSRVWDLNFKEGNHPPNHLPNHRPNHPLTTKEKEDKKEVKRESARTSTSFGKFVKLETAEYEALSAKFGKPELDAMIEKINDHCESTGRTYVGFAATIRAWFRRERPAQTAPLKAESALAFLQEKLGMDRVQEKFGILEVTSAQGYVIQQFEKKDLEAARKWFAERHGKVINGTT